MEKVITYKPKKTTMLGGLIVLSLVFFGLTLPLLMGGTPVERRELLGLGGFWLIGIILTFAPLGFRMEVGNGHVKTYFFSLYIRDLQPSNIQTLKYGNLFRAGGLGMGKGLIGWEKTKLGKSRYFSIGESFWGKGAIEHVRQVLG